MAAHSKKRWDPFHIPFYIPRLPLWLKFVAISFIISNGVAWAYLKLFPTFDKRALGLSYSTLIALVFIVIGVWPLFFASIVRRVVQLRQQQMSFWDACVVYGNLAMILCLILFIVPSEIIFLDITPPTYYQFEEVINTPFLVALALCALPCIAMIVGFIGWALGKSSVDDWQGD